MGRQPYRTMIQQRLAGGFDRATEVVASSDEPCDPAIVQGVQPSSEGARAAGCRISAITRR